MQFRQVAHLAALDLGLKRYKPLLAEVQAFHSAASALIAAVQPDYY